MAGRGILTLRQLLPSSNGAAKIATSDESQRVREVRIPPHDLPGQLVVPDGARAVVAFAHGSGSSRLSPRNNHVAEGLRQAGLGTLLFDLLQEAEEADRRNVFDIALLASRLEEASDWLAADADTAGLEIGYFGASTGAAAALSAAAGRDDVKAVVSRGGRPDLAMPVLEDVKAATLLIVGGRDTEVLELNRQALAALTCEKALEVVPEASHLFEEPGKLDDVIALARNWFAGHLATMESRG